MPISPQTLDLGETTKTVEELDACAFLFRGFISAFKVHVGPSSEADETWAWPFDLGHPYIR